MSSRELTPTSYLVLGMVAWLGPSTPYEIKRTVAATVGNVWSFPHAQLYAEPARLAEEGLLEEEREEGGRNRRIYSVTESGLEALRSWLGQADGLPYEYRETALLKLFLGAFGSAGDTAAIARRQANFYSKRLPVLEAMLTAMAEVPDLKFCRAVIQMVETIDRAVLDFWEQVAGSPPQPPEGKDVGASRTLLRQYAQMYAKMTSRQG